jgi:hypothetical protein
MSFVLQVQILLSLIKNVKNKILFYLLEAFYYLAGFFGRYLGPLLSPVATLGLLSCLCVLSCVVYVEIMFILGNVFINVFENSWYMLCYILFSFALFFCLMVDSLAALCFSFDEKKYTKKALFAAICFCASVIALAEYQYIMGVITAGFQEASRVIVLKHLCCHSLDLKKAIIVPLTVEDVLLLIPALKSIANPYSNLSCAKLLFFAIYAQIFWDYTPFLVIFPLH